MATSAGAVAAAAVARARREIREHFEQAQAFGPEHAVAYEPPTRVHARQLGLLVGRGILRDSGDGRYWIDREAIRLEEERRKAALVLLLKILLVGLVIGATAAFLLSR